MGPPGPSWHRGGIIPGRFLSTGAYRINGKRRGTNVGASQHATGVGGVGIFGFGRGRGALAARRYFPPLLAKVWGGLDAAVHDR